MTSKHMPEPWTATERPAGHSIMDANDSRVAVTDHVNARRIIACVNACAGIPTEALEQGALAEVRAAIDALFDEGFVARRSTDRERVTAALARLHR